MQQLKTFFSQTLSALRESKWRLFLFLLGLAITLAGGAFTFSNHLLAQLIPISTTDLVQIGRLTSIKGTVDRKLNNDLIWLPISKSKSVFYYDKIKTGSNSSLDFSFNDSTKVHIKANSFVKLKMIGDIPYIDLLAGDITAELGKVQKLLVRKGQNIELLSGLLKDIYKISEEGHEKVEKAGAPPDESEATSNENEAQPSETLEESKPIAYEKEFEVFEEDHLPFPPINSWVLYKDLGQLSLKVASACNSAECLLVIYDDGGHREEVNFRSGEPLGLRVNLKNLGPRIQWYTEGLEENLKGAFFSQPFSTEALEEALTSEQSVEIVE